MKTFEDRLVAYFEEKDITSEKMQKAIRQVLGEPVSTYEEILESNDVTRDSDDVYYDADFESVLDNYANIFDETGELFLRLCGYYGTDSIYVTKDLEGVSISGR